MGKKRFQNDILKNIGWLIFDRLFLVILHFLVGVKIANYYGSEVYGSYAYAMAIIAFSPLVLELVNARVIKKYYVEYIDNEVVSCVTTFKNLIAILLFLGLGMFGLMIKMEKNFYLMLLLLTLDNIFMTSTFGIENFFEYKLKSRYVVISNNIVKLISYSLQYIGILLSYPIIIIPLVRCVGSLIRSILLKNSYYRVYKQKIKFNLSKKILFQIINESKYLWVTFISYLIYTYLDRLMIANMLGNKEVGVYSISLQLKTLTLIVLPAINNSIFPKLMNLYNKDYEKYKQMYLKVNTIITQTYILVLFLSIPAVKWLFPYIFKPEYKEAVTVYFILSIGTLFSANAALQSGHIVLKKIAKYSVYKTIVGLITNGILNVLLISHIGISGAAIATVITTIITNFLLDFFIKDYKEHAMIQLKSLNPLNLNLKINKIKESKNE